LEERGKLNVDDPVNRYYSDAPDAWDKITLYHLLTHTSGIPNHTTFPEFESLSTSRTTPNQLVKTFRDRPLEFGPGSEMRYSNSGYVLLGAIIEKVSGTSYEKFVDENVFMPLAMNDSGYDSTQSIILRRAAGYGPGPKGPVNARYVDMTVPYARRGVVLHDRGSLALAAFAVRRQSAFQAITKEDDDSSQERLCLRPGRQQAIGPQRDPARRQHQWL
jgi:CubicO group peptidase (beta-lactamase class C family)